MNRNKGKTKSKQRNQIDDDDDDKNPIYTIVDRPIDDQNRSLVKLFSKI